MFKTYHPFDPFTPYDANSLLRQGLIVVANKAERDALPDATDGMRCYRLDTRLIETYNGTGWRKIASRPVMVALTSAVDQGWSTQETSFRWGGAVTTPIIDTDHFFNPANNYEVVAPFAGLYRIGFSLYSTGIIPARGTIYRDGTPTPIAGASFGTGGSGTNPQDTGVLQLAAGSALQLRHLSPNTGAGWWNVAQCHLTVEYLGEL